jgi:hypothetical protein
VFPQPLSPYSHSCRGSRCENVKRKHNLRSFQDFYCKKIKKTGSAVLYFTSSFPQWFWPQRERLRARWFQTARLEECRGWGECSRGASEGSPKDWPGAGQSPGWDKVLPAKCFATRRKKIKWTLSICLLSVSTQADQSIATFILLKRTTRIQFQGQVDTQKYPLDTAVCP